MAPVLAFRLCTACILFLLRLECRRLAMFLCIPNL